MFKLKKNWKYSEVFKIAALLGVILVLGAVVSVLSVFAYVSKDLPSPDKINARQIIESTKIYDRTGQIILYDVHGEEKRTVISSQEIPNDVKWAAVSAEDENFYKHNGFDFKAIIRAFLANLKGGQIAQGGSTITQQLIKNSILSSARTYKRKIKEIILAWQTERTFSKDEILSMYLNQISYGSNAYGVEAASQTFFNKNAINLSLAESALLAVLPQAPTYFSPYGSHYKETKTKQEKILDKMANLGYISQEQADQAKQEQLNFAARADSIKAPHFVIYVKEYLAKKYGDKALEQDGLKVITTLDISLQQIAEQAAAKANLKRFNARNAALTALDPKTGQILVMVGSRDYFDLANDGNVNVTTSPRQPGSSFKPFVYATAFKKGFSPETVIFDVETSFGKYGDKEYIPQNYNEKFHGPVTMRQALAQSINVASVKVLYLAGVKDSIKTASDLGITTLTDPNRYGLSLVLGGGEVTLLEETAGYSVFANNGIRNKLTAILRVENNKGEILEEFKPEGKRVLDKEIAYLINDVMSDNETRAPAFGFNNPMYFGVRKVAAKTGTTQDYRDAWLVGYTPSLAAGVWVGNNDNSSMNNAPGARAAGPIWREFMEKALEDKPIEEFIKPEIIAPNAFPLEKTIQIDKISGKLATALTPPELIINKYIKEAHSILYYIDQNDPQFASWEQAVSRWAQANNYNAKTPTEYDDIHTLENKPTISITQININNQIATLTALAKAPLGIKQLDFFLDNEFVGTDRTEPFLISFFVAEPGSHIITVKAYDKVSNSSEAKTEINIP